jgi:CHAD domain-containing protein
VRILAKRLRYALDLYSVVLPRHETSRYIEALAGLQDVLGELNDAAVALAALRTLTQSKALARAVARRRRALDAKAVPAVEASLAALRKLAAPWDGKQRVSNRAKSA